MPPVPVHLCLAGREVTDCRVRPGGRWVSAVLSEPGLNGAFHRLSMWRVDDDATRVDLLLDPMPMAGRGLSGGAHCWHGDGGRLYVVAPGEGIVEVAVDGDRPGRVRRLSFDAARSWSTPALDASNTTLYAICDWRELWACDLRTGAVSLVHRADDFAIDATAGVHPRFHTWRRPHMPWTQSAVHPEPAGADVAVQQPRFSSNGSSYGHVSDATGVANVHIAADAIVDHDVVIDDECEHAGPVWGPGQRTWCFNTDGTKLAYTRNESGFGTLWILDRVSGTRTRVDKGVFGCLSWEGATLAALRTGARTPQHLVAYDTAAPAVTGSAPTRRILVRPASAEWFDEELASELVEPSVHGAPGDDIEVPYRLYRAARPNWGVIVWVHGGPIDQWQVTFRPKMAHWLSRGWSVAVVDHRGTTGHGRAFQQMLEGHWGDRDAADTVAVVRQVQRAFGFRPERTVLMGASAGGLSVLNALCLAPGIAAAAVVGSPVVDLGQIIGGDDPFESHYMERLIGAGPDDTDLLWQRSPLSRAHLLAGTPVLVFHGDQDHSVPLSHSQLLRERVNAAGGAVRLEVMEGAGHSFKDPAHVIRELSVTADFLAELMP